MVFLMYTFVDLLKLNKMKKKLLHVFSALALCFSVSAQTTVTITATGSAGSFNTGSVNSAGTKNDGNMVTINSSSNAGWAKFDMTSIPVGAVVMSVNCAFTTYTSTSSTALNNLYGFIGDPAVIAGATLYSNCNSGTSLNNSTWTINATNTKTLNAAGVTFVQNNITSNQLCIGFSRASTNTYNIYGYGGAVGQQPMLVVTYSVPPACSGTPNAGTVVASNTVLCAPQNVNLSLTGSTSASGLSYQWLSSPDGISWSPIATATNIATTQSVTATTYFQCAVACGTNVATSNTVTVNYGITPNGGTAVASNTLACAGQTVGVNLTGASSIAGLTYQWQSSPNGSTWTAIPSATTSALTQTYSSTVYYQAVLTCATNTASSSSVQIDPNQFYNCYCFTAPGTINTVDNIVNFKLTNSLGSVLNQASSSVSPNFISYNNTPLDLIQGSASNTVAITMGSDATQYGAAWIDFNRNGVYEVSENIGLSPSSVAGGAIVTYTFAVPAGASLGTTRIRARGGSDNIYTTDACATSTYGETEEYLVNIITPPSCLPPTSYANTAISTTAATFTWTPGGTETAWDIFVGSNPTGTTVPTATTAATSYTAAGLTPNTTYTINVRSNCGGITSSWITLTVYTGYCTPAPTSVDASGIVNVTIPTGINNATGAETGNYGDYSAQVANVYQGTSVTAAITYSTGYTYETVIWIDYNDDLDFNDAGETVYTGTSTATIPTTLNANITIPLTAPLGTHRLRIGGQDSGPVTECYTGSYGTFEDYSINVQVAPACTLTPVAGAISGPSSVNLGSTNSYTISPSAGNVQWYEATSATGPWTAITGATVATSQNVTATASGTVYLTVIASNPGCVSDTANVAYPVNVIFQGDDVCNAIPLSIGTSTASFFPYGATTQTGEVAPAAGTCTANTSWCNNTLNNSMWFTFVAPASGYVTVQSPGFDTQLAVWKAASCSDLLSAATATLVAANDDDADYLTHSGANYSSFVKAACLTPGATYYIQLDSYGAAASTESTTIVITDMGTALDASFTGLTANYCTSDAASTLTPATIGGVFTANTSTVEITSFDPAAAGVGTYTITYSINGCVSNSVTNVSICTGVQEINKTSISVYPNPTNGVLNISIPSELTGVTSIEVYDAIGKLAIKETLSNDANTINLSKLENGMYVFKIINNNKTVKVGKVVKQ